MITDNLGQGLCSPHDPHTAPQRGRFRFTGGKMKDEGSESAQGSTARLGEGPERSALIFLSEFGPPFYSFSWHTVLLLFQGI